MADPTAETLALLYGKQHEMRGGFMPNAMSPPETHPSMPFRPADQPIPEPPSAHGMYVDRVEDHGPNGAVLQDASGHMHDSPFHPGMLEGHYEDGSMPGGSEADQIRARLSAGDDGRTIDLGAALPKVPLAPGSPGPPLPPPADSMIGQKKPGKKNRRVTP